MVRSLSAVYDSIVRYGFVCTLKTSLSNRGFHVFSRIRYPIGNIDVEVRSNPVWAELQEDRYEPRCLRTVSGLVHEGDTVIDVGAYAGIYTILLSRLVGDHGIVTSFEPDPLSREILRDNVRRNHLSNVRIEASSVSNQIGSALLRISDFGASTNTLLDQVRIASPRQISVPATTLDAYCKSNRLRPQGVKIDVEGAEGLVLQGMQETIRESSPWVLLELHNRFMSQEMRDETWGILTKSAKEIIYVEGKASSHKPGDLLSEAPLDSVANLLIKY